MAKSLTGLRETISKLTETLDHLAEFDLELVVKGGTVKTFNFSVPEGASSRGEQAEKPRRRPGRPPGSGKRKPGRPRKEAPQKKAASKPRGKIADPETVTDEQVLAVVKKANGWINLKNMAEALRVEEKMSIKDKVEALRKAKKLEQDKRSRKYRIAGTGRGPGRPKKSDAGSAEAAPASKEAQPDRAAATKKAAKRAGRRAAKKGARKGAKRKAAKKGAGKSSTAKKAAARNSSNGAKKTGAKSRRTAKKGGSKGGRSTRAGKGRKGAAPAAKETPSAEASETKESAES